MFIKTVRDHPSFRLSFQIPDQAPLYQTRPAQFISHFIGHEGPGSVCAYLKKKGWLVSLSSGPNNRNRSVPMFDISGTLTKEGYRTSYYFPMYKCRYSCSFVVHYRDVVQTIYDYISLLRVSTFDPYHFHEIAQMAATRFRFQEKYQPHTYARDIACRLLEPIPPERILDFGALTREWDEDSVQALLGFFAPDKGRVLLMAKDHEPGVLGEADGPWEVERWYGTEYKVKRLDAEVIEKVRFSFYRQLRGSLLAHEKSRRNSLTITRSCSFLHPTHTYPKISPWSRFPLIRSVPFVSLLAYY